MKYEVILVWLGTSIVIQAIIVVLGLSQTFFETMMINGVSTILLNVIKEKL